MSRTTIKPKGPERIPFAIAGIEIQIFDDGAIAMQTRIRSGTSKSKISEVDGILKGLKKQLGVDEPVVKDKRSPLIEVIK